MDYVPLREDLVFISAVHQPYNRAKCHSLAPPTMVLDHAGDCQRTSASLKRALLSRSRTMLSWKLARRQFFMPRSAAPNIGMATVQGVAPGRFLSRSRAAFAS